MSSPEATMDATPRAAGPPAYGAGRTRTLVLGWCLWLLGAWAVTLWIDSPAKAVRWMVFSSLIGLMAIWPALRLSQSSKRASSEGGAALLDWLCLMLVFQAVIWPLRLSMHWSFTQTWWLDGAIAAWSGLTALIIAWGRRFDNGGGRTVAMIACLALLLAEPVVMRLSGASWMLRVSPIQTLWALTDKPENFVPEPWITHVTLTALAAVLGWGAFTITMLIQRRNDDPRTRTSG